MFFFVCFVFLRIPYILIYSKSETHSPVYKNKKFIILSYEVSLVSIVFLFWGFPGGTSGKESNLGMER